MITILIKNKRKSIREEDMAYLGELEKGVKSRVVSVVVDGVTAQTASITAASFWRQGMTPLVVVEERLGCPAVVQLTVIKWAGDAGGLTWEKEGEMVVAAGLRGQLFGAAAGGTHKGKWEKRGQEGRREKSGVIFFVSEGRSTHNSNPYFYFIYLLIYLFT